MTAQPGLVSSLQSAMNVADVVISEEINNAIEEAIAKKLEEMKRYQDEDYIQDVRRIAITPLDPSIGKCELVVIDKLLVHIYGFMWMIWGKLRAEEIYYAHFITNKSDDSQFADIEFYITGIDEFFEFSPAEIDKLDQFHDNGGYQMVNRQSNFIFVESIMEELVGRSHAEIEENIEGIVKKFREDERDHLNQILRDVIRLETARMIMEMEKRFPVVETKRARRD